METEELNEATKALAEVMEAFGARMAELAEEIGRFVDAMERTIIELTDADDVRTVMQIYENEKKEKDEN